MRMRTCIILTMICLLRWNTFGQDEKFGQDAPALRDRPGMSPIQVDLVNLPSPDSLKSRLWITFDIPQSFFVFIRDTKQATSYSAASEISIEILDTMKHSVTRHIIHKDLKSQTPLPEHDVLIPPITQSMWFDLDPGTYDCVVEVNDLQSARKFTSTTRKVVKDFRQQYSFSDIIILSPDSTGENTISPLLLGGDAPFGKEFKLYFEIHSVHDTLRNLSLKFFRYEHHPMEKDLTFRDSSATLPLRRVQIGSIPDDSLSTFPMVPSTGGRYTAVIPVRGDQIEYGRYMLEVKCLDGDKKITLGKLMNIRWLSMPRSLMMIDYAIDMMAYDLSKDKFDSLKSLSREEQVHAFKQYWKSKDPTPATAYNEALEEYYRRVDNAQTAYASVTSPDGAKTDRGRISILFGIPSVPERYLPTDGAPVEIWTYPELHKRFIFEDKSRNGSYVLIRVEQI